MCPDGRQQNKLAADYIMSIYIDSSSHLNHDQEKTSS